MQIRDGMNRPAAKPSPPIFRSAVTAWLEAFLALVSMRWLTVVAFVALTATTMLQLFLEDLATDPSGSGALRVLADLVAIVPDGLAQTPLAIAVHRYVLLGEVARRYDVDLGGQRFRRFFGWSLAVTVMWAGPLFLASMPREDDFSGMVAGLILALMVAGVIFAVRTTILFPAIAVDAEGATVGNAFEDTKGRSWRVFFILVVTLIPGILLLLAYGWVLRSPAQDFAGSLIAGLIGGLATLVEAATVAAMAARLYGGLGDQLGPPRVRSVTDVFV
jgi:hypothetical protein